MKMYLYFLKENPNTLYGFTAHKPFAKAFEHQRNMNLFYHGTKKMSEMEFKAFSFEKSSKQLIEDQVHDNGEEIQIISTIEESQTLSESLGYMEMFFESMDDTFNTQFGNLKKKYKDSIDRLITSVLITDEDDACDETTVHPKEYSDISCNTFQIFCHLFQNTFYETTEAEDYMKRKK